METLTKNKLKDPERVFSCNVLVSFLSFFKMRRWFGRASGVVFQKSGGAGRGYFRVLEWGAKSWKWGRFLTCWGAS